MELTPWSALLLMAAGHCICSLSVTLARSLYRRRQLQRWRLEAARTGAPLLTLKLNVHGRVSPEFLRTLADQLNEKAEHAEASLPADPKPPLAPPPPPPTRKCCLLHPAPSRPLGPWGPTGQNPPEGGSSVRPPQSPASRS